MNTLWSKILFVVLDVAMLVYLVFAMTSFNKPLIATDDTCPKVDINIEETATDGFLTTDDIKAILMANKLYPLGKHIDEVNTRRIEEVLTDNQLIETAMCYTTSENNVIINLKQRTAVVRVKSINGQDYYIDSKGSIIPKVQYPTDLIIATGYISEDYAKKYLSKMGYMLIKDNFWKDEIEQINVLQTGAVELVPRTGSHIIYLGDPVSIDKKMERLYKFYKYGLNKIGWNKYSYINIEFSNQIICTKKKENI